MIAMMVVGTMLLTIAGTLVMATTDGDPRDYPIATGIFCLLWSLTFTFLGYVGVRERRGYWGGKHVTGAVAVFQGVVLIVGGLAMGALSLREFGLLSF